MRIGVLTGGGDAPGINACLKTIVTQCDEYGFEVFGIKRGWKGLLSLNPDVADERSRHIVPLTRPLVRKIDRTGGTFLHSSRVNPGNLSRKEVPLFLQSALKRMERGLINAAHFDATFHILRVLEHLGLDTLIVIGGDDTISYAWHLQQQGVAVVAIPKTMDNDVFGTDYCIGFGTAVTRSVQYIHQLRTSSGSHERITIVELFGRHTGEACLVSSYLAGVDRTLIPEAPFDPERLADLLILDKAANTSNYAMVAVSEGARMVGGKFIEYCRHHIDDHVLQRDGIGQLIRDTMTMLTGEEIIWQPLGYLMRSGIPDALDIMVGCNFAQLAVELIRKNVSGVMVALSKGVYDHVPLAVVASGTHQVDIAELYDSEEYRPRMRCVLGKPMFFY